MKNVEDIYPLSPAQQGILFHCLYSPQVRMYTSQLSYRLRGDFDPRAFVRAWRRVIERHTIFRTAFVWEGLDEPLQVVLAGVELPVREEDWSGLPLDEQQKRLGDFLNADRLRGFKFSEAPLLRLALFSLGESAWQCVWTYHHLLMDGWSETLVLNELNTLYRAFRRNAEAEHAPAPPFGRYIDWLRRQDLTSAEQFWRGLLEGFKAPTALGAAPAAQAVVGAEAFERRAQKIFVSEETTGGLRMMSRQYRLTLNVLVQGAWALLLSRLSGLPDVVFGATVSGRPSDLPGVESMVGLFINTLPVRVRLAPEETLVEWLEKIQEQQAAMLRYQYSPLVQVQSWSEVPRGLSLFETILVFQNTPLNSPRKEAAERSGSAEISNVQFNEGATNFAMSVDVEPGAQLALNVSYDSQRFDDAFIERLLGSLEAALATFVAEPGISLGALRERLDEFAHRQHLRSERELEAASARKLGEIRRRVVHASAPQEGVRR